MLVWFGFFFLRGCPGSCVFPARRQGVCLYRIIQPFCPGCWPPSRVPVPIPVSLLGVASPATCQTPGVDGRPALADTGTGTAELSCCWVHPTRRWVSGANLTPSHSWEGASNPARAAVKNTGQEGDVLSLRDPDGAHLVFGAERQSTVPRCNGCSHGCSYSCVTPFQ